MSPLRQLSAFLKRFFYEEGPTVMHRMAGHGELPAILTSSRVLVPPYERLAAIFHDYSMTYCRDYAAILLALSRTHESPISSVLDLACGTGTMTVLLAEIAGRVVGLDMSPTMLAEARIRCKDYHQVRFIEGDFRSVDLPGERFDAAVCAGDSLNYLRDVSELGQVFGSVSHHLQDRGLFVFDALPSTAMQSLAGRKVQITINGQFCELFFTFDPESRSEDAYAVFASAIERHRRVPVEQTDVATALSGTSLRLLEHFTVDSRDFYVLRKDTPSQEP